MISDMREQRWRNYFTIFFLPVIPLGKGQRVMVCPRCESAFPLEMAYERPQREIDAEFEVESEKTTLACRYCDGKFRVPVLAGKTMLVTCPHCGRKIEITQ
jgi:DNA-directed RNA polymerase subunit RPC12/RpoP